MKATIYNLTIKITYIYNIQVVHNLSMGRKVKVGI